MTTNKIPARKWYILPLLLLITAIGTGIVSVSSNFHAIDEGERFAVPGSHVFTIDKPGKYTIFYEYRDDNKLSEEVINDLSLHLRNKTSGSIIELKRLSGYSSYSHFGRHGISIAGFQAEEPGTYILTADYEGPEIVLTIVHDYVKSVLFMTGCIFAAVCLFILSILSFAGILFIRFIRKKEIPA